MCTSIPGSTLFYLSQFFHVWGILSVCMAVHHMCAWCPRRRGEKRGINMWAPGLKRGSSRVASVRTYSRIYFGDICSLGSLAGPALTTSCSHSRSAVPNPPTFPVPWKEFRNTHTLITKKGETT